MDAELLVPRDDHVARGVAPGRCLLEVGAELGGVARMARDRVGRRAQVPLRDEVRVDVVVGDRAVLVRAGDAVDAEAALRVVVAERAPQPRRLDEQLEADLALEHVVVGRRVVAGDGVGDGGVDVERRPCRRASSRSTPARGSSATGTRPRRARAGCARSRARSSVEWRQRSASAAACGAV